MKLGLSVCLVFAMFLAGCSTINGADETLPSDGTPPAMPSTDPDYHDATYFVKLYALSAAPSARNDPTAAHDMLKAGLYLVYDNCDSYFRSAGDTQKWIYVGHDAIGLIGTSATGAMGALGATASSIAWVGLITTNLYSGIDIFTKNFLFARDNIDSVQTAVLRQLDVDRDVLLKSGNTYNYYTARKAVLDEQAVCTDAQILEIVHNTLADPGVAKATDVATINAAAISDRAKK